MRRRVFLVLLIAALVSGCGGGSSGGSGGTSSTTGVSSSSSSSSTGSLSGTAATGSPLAGATITFVDATGATLTTTAGSDGTYSIDISSLVTPILICATNGTDTLYSIAYETGTVNITPLTTAALAAFFQAEGTTLAAAFASPSTTTLPSAASMQLILQSLMTELSSLLTANGIDPFQFDPRTSAFSANHTGFDACLDGMTFPSTTTLTTVSGTVTTTVTLSGAAGSHGPCVTTRVRRRDSQSGATSDNSQTTQLANVATPGLDHALRTVNQLLAALMNVINAKGSSLQASDIVSLLPSGFVNQGQDAATFAANLVSDFAGSTLTAVVVTNVDSYDATTGSLTVTVVFNTSTQTETFHLTFTRSTGGEWQCLGDQKPEPTGRSIFYQNARSISNSADTGFVPLVVVDFLAPRNLVDTVKVTDPTATFFATAATSVPKSSRTDVSPFGQLRDDFALSATASSLPAVGTIFTLDVTPVGGTVFNIPSTVRTTSTDTIGSYQLTVGGSTVSHALSSVVGKTVSATWTLPTTFRPDQVRFDVILGSAAIRKVITSRCTRDATSGSIAIPTTITNPLTSSEESVTEAIVMVEALGRRGEDVVIYDDYK